MDVSREKIIKSKEQIIRLARERMHKKLKMKAISDKDDKKIAKFFAVYEGPHRIIKKVSADYVYFI